VDVTAFGDIRVGDRAAVRRTVTEADVARFVELTGDDNPLHVDRDYAEGTPFRDVVVHGMLGASLLSTVIGTKLPGEGALWVSQSFDFRAPVRLGDEIEVSATVTAKHDSQRLLDLSAEIVNQRGEIVLAGAGRVRALEAPPPPPPATGLAPVAVVTGGSGGIGSAICAALADDGFAVVVGYRADERRARRVVDDVREAGGEAIAVAADLAAEDGAARLVDEARRRFGGVGVVVANASGRIAPKPLDGLRWSDVQDHLDVQVRSALTLTQAAIPSMRERGAGRIVCIGSQVVDVPVAAWTGYAMAKAALQALSRQLAEELGPEGITVNCVAPGLTETRLVGDLTERARLIAARQTPLRRLATPRDVAGAVAYLASDAGAFVSGQTLHVDGGRTMT